MKDELDRLRHEGDRRRAEGAAPGRAARLEGAPDLRPRPRGDLLGARRAGRRRPRARPLLRHRRPGDRGALARRRDAPSSSTATPARRSATSSASASASGPSWSAPTSAAGWRQVSAGPSGEASTSSSSMPPIDSPTAWPQDLNTHLPQLLADGRSRDRRERRPPAAADRLAGARCASAATAPPTSPSTREAAE